MADRIADDVAVLLIQARAGRPAILRDPLCDREKLRAAVLAEAERQGLEVNVGLIDRGVSVEVVVKQ